MKGERDELACACEILKGELEENGVYVTDGVDDYSEILSRRDKQQQIKALEYLVQNIDWSSIEMAEGMVNSVIKYRISQLREGE